ncbi:MAG: complex I subunit 5 family protein [Rhizobiaceae bacterium]|nr:complex I subunit 5 family protein [Rhizobiaceae bacterium]
MTLAGFLLATTLAFPLVLALACVKLRTRSGLLSMLALAPLPGLLAAFFAPGGVLVFAPAPMRLTLSLDSPGAVLLGGAAFLWFCAGLYAGRYMRDDPRIKSFAIGWLLTLAGSLGVFLVADLASFYLVFALVSLCAYQLVCHEGTPRAARASLVYMILAVAGEAFLLLAFVMMSTITQQGNPQIADAVAMISRSEWRDTIICLLVLGFGLKMGLFPLHVWMPLAHPVAPMPASAVLSGIVVKAGVIGLIRFLPFDSALASWGTALMTLGFVTTFYAVAVGIVQRHPKTVLAYSTISQMGFIAAILGAGVAAGDIAAVPLAAFYALHHMLAKGALFLGVGVVGGMRRQRLPVVLVVCAVLSLSLAGLPFTSGALAKFAAKELFGYGLASTLATFSAVGSALLMVHFMQLLSAHGKSEADKKPERGLVLPWSLVACASIIAPFMLFEPVTGYRLMAAFTPSALWKSVFPILLGAAFALLVRRYGRHLPAIPEGDIVVIADAAVPTFVRFSDGLVRADVYLRRWPIAGMLLVGIALALGLALGRIS